ncbi:MAG: AraC family transcriptional regulator [Lachnospiraceae bacterium]|nr:AraC family transcriptional regulator [Lachnospiraceae bacterium]
MQVDLIEALRNYLMVFNISVQYFTAPYEGIEDFDYGLRKVIDPYFEWKHFTELLLTETVAETLTMTEDFLGVHYGIFLPPATTGDFVIIGPFLSEDHTTEKITWIKQHLGPENSAILQSYYSGIPVIEAAMLFRTLPPLVSMLYPAGTLRIVESREYIPLRMEPDLSYFHEPSFQWDIPAAMLERRYEAENAFMEAVSAGNADQAVQYWNIFRTFDLGSRFVGSLRKKQNGVIIANTLLRKAIERAKVHPYYIDEISGRYSNAIENAKSEQELNQMNIDMLREYSAYVQKYSLRQYSPLMQKVINYINLNLAESQSLNILSDAFHVSSSYLSNLFKQETGQTLTAYINNQRMVRAANRLEHTDDTISAIAESVGFLDLNYFTKVFKKVIGVTPSQYRADKQRYGTSL